MSAEDYAYDLNNTPAGTFYQVKDGNHWYEFPAAGVVRAVGDVWYSRIVWHGVNGFDIPLPQGAENRFIFSPKKG